MSRFDFDRDEYEALRRAERGRPAEDALEDAVAAARAVLEAALDELHEYRLTLIEHAVGDEVEVRLYGSDRGKWRRATITKIRPRAHDEPSYTVSLHRRDGTPGRETRSIAELRAAPT